MRSDPLTRGALVIVAGILSLIPFALINLLGGNLNLTGWKILFGVCVLLIFKYTKTSFKTNKSEIFSVKFDTTTLQEELFWKEVKKHPERFFQFVSETDKSDTWVLEENIGDKDLDNYSGPFEIRISFFGKICRFYGKRSDMGQSERDFLEFSKQL